MTPEPTKNSCLSAALGLALMGFSPWARAEFVVTAAKPDGAPVAEQALAQADRQLKEKAEEFKREHELVSFFLRGEGGGAMLAFRWDLGAQDVTLDHDIEKALADPSHRVTVRLELKAVGPDAYGYLHGVVFEIARGDLGGEYAYEVGGGSFIKEGCEELRRALLKNSNAHARVEKALCVPTGSTRYILSWDRASAIVDEYAIRAHIRLSLANEQENMPAKLK